MELHTIGIDLGKTVFHLVGLNHIGRVAGHSPGIARTRITVEKPTFGDESVESYHLGIHLVTGSSAPVSNGNPDGPFCHPL